MSSNREETTSKVNLQLEQAIHAILGDRPIAYHAALAKTLGSVTAGVLLSQLLYWQPRSRDADGWFWKTQKDIYEETALSRREHDTARLVLKRAGVLEEKLRGVPARMHYRVNLTRLVELLSIYQTQSDSPPDGSDASLTGGTEQSSLAESAKLVWRKTPDQLDQNRQTITETTTEITPETTTENTLFSKGKLLLSRKRNASRFSKKQVSNQQNNPSDELEDPDTRPRRAAQSSLKPVGELISHRQAVAYAAVSPPAEQPAPRRRKVAPEATPQIEHLLTDFSSELHDEEHTAQNISQATRLWKESGRSESVFCQLVYEARALTKQYRVKKRAQGPGGEMGLRNKMPYFFSVLKDLLGMKPQQPGTASQAPPG